MLAVFGNQLADGGGGAFTASMEWISPDLTEKELYVFEPRYASTIYAAIPTGTLGEFVVAREVWPTRKVFGYDEKRQGALLTFIQVR